MAENGNGTQLELGKLIAAVEELSHATHELPEKFAAVEARSTRLFNECMESCNIYKAEHKQYHKDREPYWGMIAWAHKRPFRFTLIVVGTGIIITILHQQEMSQVYGFLAKTLLRVL